MFDRASHLLVMTFTLWLVDYRCIRLGLECREQLRKVIGRPQLKTLGFASQELNEDGTLRTVPVPHDVMTVRRAIAAFYNTFFRMVAENTLDEQRATCMM